MIIVTGGAGFIGSNIVKGLNDLGREDILVVDNLTNMVKFKNIQGLKVMDYLDKVDFIQRVRAGKFDHEPIEVIFHEGACSDTMEYNGKYMMENNFEYTKTHAFCPGPADPIPLRLFCVHLRQREERIPGRTGL